MSGLQFTQQVARPKGLPPSDELNPWYWNPGLIGIKLAPEWFRTKLHDIDEELEVTWNREAERWQMWVKKPSLHTRICRGWFYLFPVQDSAGNYVPLDERTLAKVYTISAKQWGSGKKYFDAVEREQQRARAKADARHDDQVGYEAGEYFDYTLPKVGYGPISGSKVVGQ